LADHAQKWLLDACEIAPVPERGRELLGESDPLVELADGEKSGVAGQWGGGDLDLDGA
jgi:hypothetical protein